MNENALQIAEDRESSSEYEQQPNQSGLNLFDILFMLFRHKWKIIGFALGGFLAAGFVYLYFPPIYESNAKLFVRYVLDKSEVDGMDPQIKTPNPLTDTLISSEAEILTSQDLAREVAETVGVEKILGVTGPKASLEKATQAVLQGLDVSPLKGTNIIEVSFRSANPKIPTPVLQELVTRYFAKHMDVHRSIGAFEFVAKETEKLRAQLDQTEDELKQLKAKAGVISLKESQAALATELGKAQEELDAGQAEYAAQKARVSSIEESLALNDKSQTGKPSQPASPEAVQKYQSLATQLAQLQQSEADLLSRYTAENRLVKIKAAQIAGIQKQRADLEKAYPTLIGMVPVLTSSASGPARPDIMSERARLVGLESRLDTLRTRVSELQAKAHLMEELGPRIEQLEREKELQETSYEHSQASLAKAQIDETLDPSRMPNISVVQTPTPAMKAKRDVKKFVIALAGGGVAAGLAIALLIELVLDRSVKRSHEIENQLRIPVLMSIPYLGPPNRRLHLHDAGDETDVAELDRSLELGPDDEGEMLKPFCEAIRDRLGLFFELNQMAHKPKLVAVTSLAADAGASSLAAGLANAISETAEGKVLLVDKVTGPKRFYSMLTDFKSSNLDYVVFDMPPLGDVSSTLPLAGFMDTVLLVIEAEKSNRAAVKRAYAELSAKTKVSVVFNKSRSYGPKWLERDI